ncbi:MAG: hypothetical protein Q7T74_01295, partial [Candidatus Saccharibacteria bacterium]|nr:hypothetical protein [Candidatus Saccharibacteria bacterium]
GSGILGTTNAQTLTLGGATTGNIFLSPTGSNKIGIGFNTSPLAALDVRSSFGTTPIASFSGTSSFAGLLVDNSGLGDIITASMSGAPRFAVTNNGSLQFTGGSGILQTLYSDADDPKSYRFPDFTGVTAMLCLDTGNCAGAGGVVGGAGTLNYVSKFTATGSLIGNSSIYDDGNIGIGTAAPIGNFNLVGNRAGQALAVLDYTGTDQDILAASSSGVTQFTLGNTGNIGFTGGTSYLNTLTSDATAARTYTFPDATGDVCLTTGNCAGAGGGIVGSGTDNRIARFSATQTIEDGSINDLYASGVALTISDLGRIGINSTLPIGTLDVRSNVNYVPVASFSGSTLVATLLADNSGSGDIFTASSSGQTRFTLQNTGNILFYGNQTSAITLTSAAVSPQTITFPNSTGTICLQGSVDCGFAIGANYLQLNSNLLSPTNSTYDFAIGGTSTASAKFAFVNVAGGTPTATISANSGNIATYISGSGNL